MFKPLVIGLPFILIVVLAFVVGMNVLPFGSPYFPYVIGGYGVLLAAGLLFTIVGTIRAAKRAMQGGDPGLQTTGRRAKATVIAVTPSAMTMRVGGGMPMRLLYVTLRIEDFDFGGYEVKVTKALQMWDAAPGVGTRVPVYVDPTNKKNVFVAWAQSEPGAGADRVDGQSLAVDARHDDLSHLPAGLQHILRMGLDRAQGLMRGFDASQLPPEAVVQLKALGIDLGETQPPDGPPVRTMAGQSGAGDSGSSGTPAREPGRARIEALQPNPDGTYELDLFVSPKSRPSYRLTVALAVPQEHAGRMRKGQYFAVLLDPEVPETIEIDWDKL